MSYVCPDCLLSYDWCPECGCACWCWCWMEHPLPRAHDERLDLWRDEYRQGTRGRPIDTVRVNREVL